MNVSIKKTVAILLVIAVSTLYFMACGVKDTDKGASGDPSTESALSAEGSDSIASDKEISAGSKAENSASSKEESFATGSSEEESRPTQNSSAPDTSDVSSSQVPDSSEESSTNNSSSASPDSSEEVSAPDDSSAAPPDDSSVAPPDDSSVAPPDDSSVAPPDDSSVAPPDDSSIAPPDDSSIAPPDDSSVAPPDDSSVAPPDDSSEESIYIPSDPSDPLTPIPEALYADPIDSFFNDSVFVGYSIMMHFGRYIGEWRAMVDSSIMGNAINVSAVGISFYKNSTQTPSMSDNSLPRFRGVAYNFEDLPAATGSKAMYIGLTCYSDMKYYGNSQTAPQLAAEAVIEGIKKIVAENPGVNIVILSGTYNTGTFEQLGLKNAERLDNENVRKFNNYVLDYCNQNGVDFVDVSTPLTNGYGFMPIEYSSDNDYHIAKEPFLIWIDILRDYARQKEAGTWKNITVMPTLGA